LLDESCGTELKNDYIRISKTLPFELLARTDVIKGYESSACVSCTNIE
jgi:hypothetical protein